MVILQNDLSILFLEDDRIMELIIKFGTWCLNILFAFVKILPVQKKITYISRQTNTTPLDFQLVIKNIQEKNSSYKHVVLAKMLPQNLTGKIGYCFHILIQMYHIATSKAVILDSYCIPISLLRQRKSLIVIQMWHALGSLKKFGYSILDQQEGSSSRIAELMKMHKNYTYVLASSEFAALHFAEAFRVEQDKIKIFPLPKTDLLLNIELKERTIAKIYKEYPQLKNQKKRVIVYAPTFRKSEDEIQVLEKAIFNLVNEIDFEKYELVIKTHFLTKISVCDGRVIFDKKFTSSEFFYIADVIVTDYSAVIFEALMLDKPIYFYAFDYDKYMQTRSFYVDYMKEMPGMIEKDASELIKTIENSKIDLERRQNFRKKMIAGCKKTYTDDFVDFLLEHLQS